MRIRPYQEHDLHALQAIHAAQAFPYEFPDLRDPLFLSKLILVEEVRDATDRQESAEPGKGSTASGERIAGAALASSTCSAGPCKVWDWRSVSQAESNFALQQSFEKQGVAFWWVDWCWEPTVLSW